MGIPGLASGALLISQKLKDSTRRVLDRIVTSKVGWSGQRRVMMLCARCIDELVPTAIRVKLFKLFILKIAWDVLQISGKRDTGDDESSVSGEVTQALRIGAVLAALRSCR